MLDFFTNNKDGIDTFLKIFAFFGISSIAGGFWWVIQRWWKQRIRIDLDIFEVITDPSTLLPNLYGTENDDSPLADHRITYQPRDPEHDTQAELKAALNRKRYLLITAPTGYGKTREAGMLAQTMMLEGWRVLRIRTGWLDVPKTLPKELGNNRSRVLVFLDDLNGLFSTGQETQSPKAEEIPMLNQTPYHDRLLDVLNMLERMCTAREIRVVATARSEPDQWKVFNFDEKDKLWQRFERVELPEPKDSAIVNLLDDATKNANIKADIKEFEMIARKSDGTYRNILINLRRWKTENKAVDTEDFNDTLNGSWKDVYEQACAKYPMVVRIYETIDIFRQTGIELFPFLVREFTVLEWGGNRIQKFIREKQIQQTLHYLQTEKILRISKSKFIPGDGQIEARNKVISTTAYLNKASNFLLQTEKKAILSSSYFGLANICYFQDKIQASYQLHKKYIELGAFHLS